MSDSSIVIIQGTVGLYTVATRCHRCFAVTLKYTEDSSLKILPHSYISSLKIPLLIQINNSKGNGYSEVNRLESIPCFPVTKSVNVLIIVHNIPEPKSVKKKKRNGTAEDWF